MNYQVISNFLPEKDFLYLYNFIFKGDKMHWYYVPYIADISDSTNFYFQNDVFPRQIEELRVEFILPIFPILYHANISQATSLIRIKYNCFIKQPTHIKTGTHIDYNFPHQVLLYSVNSNNGYTILDPRGKNIKIPSVANQALIFDGLIEHQAVTQTDENIRVNINICYN